MGKAEALITEILSMIIGVAILAVIVGSNSRTSSVIQSAGSALTSILNAAISPVTGGTSAATIIPSASNASPFGASN